MLFLIAIKLVILFNLFNQVNNQQEPWKLIRVENGIEVYSRFPSNSDFKEIKIMTEVDASLSSVVALLHDVSAYPKWIYACNKSFVIQKISDTEEFYYTQTDAPWPFSDRDVIMYSKMTQNLKSKEITFQSYGVPEKYPEIDGIVRVERITVLWKITPIEKGKLRIFYQLKADPAGKIPSWLVNLIADIGPYQTIVKLREELTKEKYKTKKVDYIIE